MKVRLPKGGPQGMGNFQDIAKQAQKVQEDIDKASKELEEKQYTASAGGGAVNVVVNGKPEVKSISIKPEVVDPDDVEIMSDMIVAAINEAIRSAVDEKENIIQGISGQMHIPGLF